MAISAIVLHVFNMAFLILGLAMIVVTIVAKATSMVTTLAILDGVLVMGIFLMVIAVLGLISVMRKFNAGVFLYMVLLCLLFVTQFSVSIAAVVVPARTQQQLAGRGWCHLTLNDKNAVQDMFSCNGFLNASSSWSDSNPCVAAGDSCGTCNAKKGPLASCSSGSCPACFTFLADQIDNLLKRGGGVSLAFSFLELLGVWAAHLFRKSTKFATKGPAYKREFL